MTLNQTCGLAFMTAALLTGCGQDYDLSTIDRAPGVDPSNPLSADRAGVDDGANEVVEDDTIDETFEIDTQEAAPVADYLFVVDSSVSMAGIIRDVRQGLTAIGVDGFPEGTKIAVMTTTPAALDGSGEPFPGVVDIEEARIDPGFQQLIDGESLVTWKNERKAARYTNEGCNGGWFAPDDRNDLGVPCVLAITAVPLYAANAEAGLVAVKQLLLARGSEPLFRDGAAANIIFISDTHDPGLGRGKMREKLIRFRPDYRELSTLVNDANVVSSLKVHAIAPMTECVQGESWKGIGTSYFDVAKASGGVIVDVCTADDYSAVLTDMTDVGARPTHGVFTLENKAAEVLGVEVDGQAVGFSVKRDGKVIKLDAKLPASKSSVKVSYR